MKKFTFKGYAEKAEGVTICVNICGKLEDYAKAFLSIWNNAREYPNTIKKVEVIANQITIFEILGSINI